MESCFKNILIVSFFKDPYFIKYQEIPVENDKNIKFIESKKNIDQCIDDSLLEFLSFSNLKDVFKEGFESGFRAGFLMHNEIIKKPI